MARKNSVDTSVVLDYIKSSPKPVGKVDIINATGYNGDFGYCIRTLMAKHDEIKKTGLNNRTLYSWDPKKAQYSEVKNPEGYNDFTAGKAIANVMKSSGKYPMRQHFGEVWSCSTVVDDMEGYLIISAKDGVIICCNIYPNRKGFMKPDYTIKWVDKLGNHYVSILHLVNVIERKVDRKLYDLDKEVQDQVKEKLYSSLGIVPEVKFEYKEAEIVEKIVEKPVEVIKEVTKEVPVEVVKEVEVIKEVTDPKAIELAVLKARCEIYERLVFGESKIPRFTTMEAV